LLDDQGSIPGGAVMEVFLTTAFRSKLRPTQSPYQWVLEVLSPRISGRDVKLTTHLHLMSRLRKRGAILLFPHYVFIA
jgi:hypothetical protein